MSKKSAIMASTIAVVLTTLAFASTNQVFGDNEKPQPLTPCAEKCTPSPPKDITQKSTAELQADLNAAEAAHAAFIKEVGHPDPFLTQQIQNIKSELGKRP